jgi:hypothetical protein
LQHQKLFLALNLYSNLSLAGAFPAAQYGAFVIVAAGFGGESVFGFGESFVAGEGCVGSLSCDFAYDRVRWMILLDVF